MANVQLENGFTKIANQIIEALYCINLSAYESRILWYIFRETYGWKDKFKEITLLKFSKDIGIDLRHIYRTLKSLEKDKMIIVLRNTPKSIFYGFQKDYEKWAKWIPIPTNNNAYVGVEANNPTTPVGMIKTPPELALSTTSTPYISFKYNIKETSQLSKSELLGVSLSELFLKEILAQNPHSRLHAKSKAEKERLLLSWGRDFRLLLEKDKQPIELIRKVILKATSDTFWKKNILSGGKLREKWDTLVSLVTPESPNVRAEKTVLEKILESEGKI